MLWDLMEKIHQEENMPEEWRDSVIVPIYKVKGDIQECGNYRRIKLMLKLSKEERGKKHLLEKSSLDLRLGEELRTRRLL